MSEAIVINNDYGYAVLDFSKVPPNAPLDFDGLAKIATNLTPQSSAPSDPSAGWIYLDDGTNTTSGKLGLRRYDGSSWNDLNVQAHSDLSGIASDDHHTAHEHPGDQQAESDIEDDKGNTIYDYANAIIPDALLNYFSGSHNDLSDVASDDHHAKYTDAEARGSINDVIGSDGKLDSDLEADGNSLKNQSTNWSDFNNLVGTREITASSPLVVLGDTETLTLWRGTAPANMTLSINAGSLTDDTGALPAGCEIRLNNISDPSQTTLITSTYTESPDNNDIAVGGDDIIIEIYNASGATQNLSGNVNARLD